MNELEWLLNQAKEYLDTYHTGNDIDRFYFEGLQALSRLIISECDLRIYSLQESDKPATNGSLLSMEALEWLKSIDYGQKDHEERMKLISAAKIAYPDNIGEIPTGDEYWKQS